MFFFPEIGRAGRLGNQLFQVAAIKALALRNKSEAYLPDDIDTRVTHGQSSLLKYFKHNLPFINSNELNELEKYYVDLFQTFNSEHGLNLRDGGGNNWCENNPDKKIHRSDY